jgi:hypothetical protein
MLDLPVDSASLKKKKNAYFHCEKQVLQLWENFITSAVEEITERRFVQDLKDSQSPRLSRP